MFLRTGHETFMYLLFVYIVYIDINLKIFYPIKINGDDFIFISFFFSVSGMLSETTDCIGLSKE